MLTDFTTKLIKFGSGFSAGYFNTVGSIHGFTPASFKSSRTAGRKTVQQRPEDFMDEEDLQEHMQLGINVRNETLFATTADELAARPSEVAPGIIVSAPVVRSIGIMLMQRMGWIRSDPIGKPRLQQRQYTVELDPSTQQSSAAPKANVYGLGYIPSKNERLNSLIVTDDDDCSFCPSKYDTSLSVDDVEQAEIGMGPSRSKKRFPEYNPSTEAISIVSPPAIERLKIPSDFKPSPCPVAEASIVPQLERFRVNIEQVVARRRRRLTLDERSAALGEEVPASTSKTQSVFDMISADGRAKLSASLASMFHVGSTLVVGDHADIPVQYPDDPAKQARFVQFLNARRDGRSSDAETCRDWRRALEMQQFEALAATLPTVSAAAKIKVEARPDLPTDYDSAARLKMFGTLTRETADWVPPRLLCKRFHVPDPYQGRAVPAPTIKKRTRFQDLLATVHPELVAAENPVKVENPVKIDDDDEEEVLEAKVERPPVDLFKAIFEDSEDDDDDDIEDQRKKRVKTD